MITKTKERTSEKLLRNLPKKRIMVGHYMAYELGRFRFSVGTKSLHRTNAGRKFNLLWRLNRD